MQVDTRDYCAEGLAYASGVASGDIAACEWVVKACTRHLADLDRQKTKDFPYRFDETAGGRVCRLIARLRHIKGPKAGETIWLEPWQCWILTTIFGWLCHGGPRDGKRRFRRVYLEMPRGQGKSALSSGIGIYMLGADREGGAECYSLATTRQQAGIVFRDAQQMLRRSPEIVDTLRLKVNAHNVLQPHTASKFEALSSESGTLDGLAVHLGMLDETHAMKDRSLYDVIETGTGKRDQSLLWCITTAGTNRAGICFELHTYLKKVLSGLAPDDAMFGVIYTIDAGDHWHIESSWRKANPNYGVSVMPEVLAQLAGKAMQMPAAQSNFRTKHLCEWMNADSSWMDMRAWDSCGDQSLDIADFEGERCYIGLDLATTTDIAAKVYLFDRLVAGVMHYYVFGKFYLPETAIADGRNSQYHGWEIAGSLTSTSGDVLDFDLVETDIIDDSRRYQVDRIGFDPWQAQRSAQRLAAQGANVLEVRNSAQNFSAPMKEIDLLVRSKRLHHDGCPVLAWMVSNVVCHTDAKENIYPRKERPENKIDGVVALITALALAMADEAGSAQPEIRVW